MVLLKCDRRGCETEPTETPVIGGTLALPKGWLRLIEGTRSTFHCCVQCFDVWWEQRRWREKRTVMAELPVDEAALLPKG